MAKVRKSPRCCLACGRILNNKITQLPFNDGTVHGWGDCAYEINREGGQINIKRKITKLKDIIIDDQAF